MAIEQYWGTGRRKTSVARVRIIPGSEDGFIVNKKPIDEYFDRSDHVQEAKHPIEHAERTGEYAVHVNVRGGGNTGQAGAISHGLARALVKADESLKPTLKKAGFLTRDPRMVERKKYGQKGARARFQFSKR
ncbi:30S ribosomal protein S9 [Candidatus Poribacteria bacterium]|nr:MAG: 30S ribosomal protein S9 [Candidatus Poribacteria bacterium]